MAGAHGDGSAFIQSDVFCYLSMVNGNRGESGIDRSIGEDSVESSGGSCRLLFHDLPDVRYWG